VGVIPAALVEFQAAIDFVPDWPATALITTVARYEQLERRRFDVGDYDLNLEIPGNGKRLFRALSRLWLQVVQVGAQVGTKLGNSRK
jgi:hypothetical protein